MLAETFQSDSLVLLKEIYGWEIYLAEVIFELKIWNSFPSPELKKHQVFFLPETQDLL
jgi:hypothetical protein